MKKAISILLAMVMVLGMSTVAFATDFPNYTQSELTKTSANLIRLGYDNSSACWEFRNYRMEGSIAVANDVELAKNILVVHESGSSSAPYIYVWAANNSTSKTYDKKVSISLADDWELKVEVTGKSGGVKNMFLDSDGKGNTVIALEMEPYLNAVSGQSFSIEGYLKSGSKKIRNTEFSIKGKYENETQEIDDEDETEIDMTEGSAHVLDVNATVRDAMIELDAGMYVNMRLTKGKDVYLRSDTSISDDDIDMMEKYDLDNIIRVYSVNAKSDSTKVLFDNYDYYVYTLDGTKTGKNAVLKYVGESADELPLLDIYILSRDKIDKDYDEPKTGNKDDDEDDDDDYEGIEFLPDLELPPLYDDYIDNPNGGGITPDNDNRNYNPSTGC